LLGGLSHPVSPESLLKLAKAAVKLVARRYRLQDADADDLTSMVIVKLMVDDYRALRNHQGRGSLAKYVGTVAFHVYLDWRRKE
jgi:DNA-directed RNA polymerase specialized sigma24 family protein